MNTDGKGTKKDKNEKISDNNNSNINNSNNNNNDIIENDDNNENQSENTLTNSNKPDILQEVQDVNNNNDNKPNHIENNDNTKQKKDDILHLKLHNITIRNQNLPTNSVGAQKSNLDNLKITRTRSGGLIMKNNSLKFSIHSNNNNDQSNATVTTTDHDPESTQSSEHETISTQSSNQISELEPISNETSIQDTEPGILSNQLSLSYDASELEPVSLYSFHVVPNLRNVAVEMKPTSTIDQHISICSVGSVVCRICHNAEEPERLISPCLCKGTLAYVHKNCLEHWLRTSGMVSCELCHYRFKVRASLRYTFLQSLRMWYSHPNNRGLLQADFLVCSLLTVVSFGLVGISMMALQHFVLQGRRYGVSRFWTQICILMFLSVISFVYSINMFLILKSQLVPWYTWWQSAKDVTLILENRKSDVALTRFKDKQKQSEEIELESMILNRDTRQLLQSPTPPLIPTPPIIPPTLPPIVPPTLNAATSRSSKINDCVTTV